jgi:hypothetical protein
MDAPRAVSIGQSEFRCPCHACAFFHSRDEEYELLLPFAKDSYQSGDRLLQIVDKEHRDERRRRLSSYGIDLEKAEGAGKFEIRVWEEAYLRGNNFNQHAMLELAESVLREGRDKGFPVTRVWANMEWALEDFPGVHDIVEYEAQANKFVSRYPAFVVCTYDLNKFSAPVVMDIMRTHPHVIISGMLQENPFYVPPDEFLAELRNRPM